MPPKFDRKRSPEAQDRQNIKRRLDKLIKELDQLQHSEFIYNSGLDHHLNDALQSVGYVVDHLPASAGMVRA